MYLACVHRTCSQAAQKSFRHAFVRKLRRRLSSEPPFSHQRSSSAYELAAQLEYSDFVEAAPSGAASASVGKVHSVFWEYLFGLAKNRIFANGRCDFSAFAAIPSAEFYSRHTELMALGTPSDVCVGRVTSCHALATALRKAPPAEWLEIVQSSALARDRGPPDSMPDAILSWREALLGALDSQWFETSANVALCHEALLSVLGVFYDWASRQRSEELAAAVNVIARSRRYVASCCLVGEVAMRRARRVYAAASRVEMFCSLFESVMQREKEIHSTPALQMSALPLFTHDLLEYAVALPGKRECNLEGKAKAILSCRVLQFALPMLTCPWDEAVRRSVDVALYSGCELESVRRVVGVVVESAGEGCSLTLQKFVAICVEQVAKKLVVLEYSPQPTRHQLEVLQFVHELFAHATNRNPASETPFVRIASAPCKEAVRRYLQRGEGDPFSAAAVACTLRVLSSSVEHMLKTLVATVKAPHLAKASAAQLLAWGNSLRASWCLRAVGNYGSYLALENFSNVFMVIGSAPSTSWQCGCGQLCEGSACPECTLQSWQRQPAAASTQYLPMRTCPSCSSTVESQLLDGGGWQCSKCGTDSKGHQDRQLHDSTCALWRCPECSQFSVLSASGCLCHHCTANGRHVPCRSSSAYIIPSHSWKCGCGSINSLVSLTCATCKGTSHSYTCPSCHCTALPARQEAPPMYEFLGSVSVCSQCSAPHPAESAAMDGSFRACAACGRVASGADTHTACQSCGASVKKLRNAAWHCHRCGEMNPPVEVRNNPNGLQAQLVVRDTCRCCLAKRINPNAFSEWTGWTCPTCTTAAGHSAHTAGFLCSACFATHLEVPQHECYVWRCQCGSANYSWEPRCQVCKKENGLHSFYRAINTIRQSGTWQDGWTGLASAQASESAFVLSRWACPVCSANNSPRNLRWCWRCRHPRPSPQCHVCGSSHLSYNCPDGRRALIPPCDIGQMPGDIHLLRREREEIGATRHTACSLPKV